MVEFINITSANNFFKLFAKENFKSKLYYIYSKYDPC